MRKFPAPIHDAVAALGRLPGVGPKTALRYVFALLRLERSELDRVAKILGQLSRVTTCTRCFTYAETPICDICADPRREEQTLCVIAEPRDIATIEATGAFRGRYLVLGGVLNPVDGLTPDKLRLGALDERLTTSPAITEVILAFSPDVHGETTILYLHRALKKFNKKITRLARGLPMGADIEYADEVTLANALSGRSDI